MKTILRTVQVTGLVAALLLPCLEMTLHVKSWISHKILIDNIIQEDNHGDMLKETIFFDLSTEVIRWVKPGKEFLLQGEYYDIVSVHVDGSCVRFECFKDVRDKHLSRRIASKLPETPNQEDNALLFSGFQLKILVNAHPSKSNSRYVTTCYTQQFSSPEWFTFPPPTPPPEMT